MLKETKKLKNKMEKYPHITANDLKSIPRFAGLEKKELLNRLASIQAMAYMHAQNILNANPQLNSLQKAS